jgi:hypothetical protein
MDSAAPAYPGEQQGTYVSRIVCQVCQGLMPAVPAGNLTQCPHCHSIYRLDETLELALLEVGKIPDAKQV